MLIIFGYLRDLLRRAGFERRFDAIESLQMKNFAPLYSSFEGFYTRNIYMRVRDTFNRPICSVPGGTFNEMVRVSYDSNRTFHVTEKRQKLINLGSYNYLGYAENHGFCNDRVVESIDGLGAGISASRNELGTLKVHRELESKWSDFLGTEATLTFGMGFATNALNIAALMGKGSCIISDELNHSSLILGCRLSGNKVLQFFNHK